MGSFAAPVSALLALAALLATSSPARCAARDPRPEVVMLILESPVPHTSFICAGVVVADTAEHVMVWTARHCLRHALRYVEFRDGSTVDGRTVNVRLGSGTADVALLGLPAKRLATRLRSVPAFRDEVPLEGEPVTVVGHPEGRTWSSCSGTVASMAMPTGMSSFAVRCPDCTYGDSGAGVFDADGRLVGMIWGAADAREPDGATRHYALATPISDLSALFAGS